MQNTPIDIPGQSQTRAVTLPNDYGRPVSVTASLVAEDIHFSTESGMLTVEKLYKTPEGKLAYGIIAASGDARERRAYTIDDQGEMVIADCGAYAIEMPAADLWELLCMALQAEDARQTVGEHVMQVRSAVNED